MYNLYNDDCLEIMKQFQNKSIDFILCDLPYGTTAHNWDSVISAEKLWEQYKRIIKDNGVICLFATQPFTTRLISSNYDMYRYSWIWKKESPNGFLNCNYAPLKITEDICVFSKGKVGSLSKNPIIYHPPCLIEEEQVKTNRTNSKYRKQNGYNTSNNQINNGKEFITKYKGYPNNILEYSRDKNTVHPTQKPVHLLEFLIKTYTEENEIVLDNCMGSGSTGVACINTNRNFIGIELDENYFEIARSRINEFK